MREKYPNTSCIDFCGFLLVPLPPPSLAILRCSACGQAISHQVYTFKTPPLECWPLLPLPPLLLLPSSPSNARARGHCPLSASQGGSKPTGWHLPNLPDQPSEGVQNRRAVIPQIRRQTRRRRKERIMISRKHGGGRRGARTPAGGRIEEGGARKREFFGREG